jgi:HSP20 family molecular chaperone IbpA
MYRVFNNYNEISEITNKLLSDIYNSNDNDFNVFTTNNKENFIVEMNALGYEKDKIDISVDKNRNLIVQCKKESSKSKLSSDINYKVRLSESLDTESIEAFLENGVLKLTINKKKDFDYTKKIVIN